MQNTFLYLLSSYLQQLPLLTRIYSFFEFEFGFCIVFAFLNLGMALYNSLISLRFLGFRYFVGEFALSEK